MKKVLIVTLWGALLSTTLAAASPQQVTAPDTKLVNINTATADQLQALAGIGPSIAKRIVEYRQQHGGFEQVEDLLLVRGIGEKKFLQLKAQVTVGD